MAIINSFFDGGRGKLGRLVVYKMKGQNIIRTKADHINDAKSLKQLAQRQRFKVTSDFLSRCSDLIRYTFADETDRRTAYSLALSHNMKNGLSGEYPDIYLDKNKVLLSRGPLPLPASARLSMHPEGFMVQWENGPEMTDNRGSDFLVVFILPAIGPCDYRITETRRSAGQYIWKATSQDPLPDVWIAFRNRQMIEWSNSMLVK